MTQGRATFEHEVFHAIPETQDRDPDFLEDFLDDLQCLIQHYRDRRAILGGCQRGCQKSGMASQEGSMKLVLEDTKGFVQRLKDARKIPEKSVKLNLPGESESRKSTESSSTPKDDPAEPPAQYELVDELGDNWVSDSDPEACEIPPKAPTKAIRSEPDAQEEQVQNQDHQVKDQPEYEETVRLQPKPAPKIIQTEERNFRAVYPLRKGLLPNLSHEKFRTQPRATTKRIEERPFRAESPLLKDPALRSSMGQNLNHKKSGTQPRATPKLIEPVERQLRADSPLRKGLVPNLSSPTREPLPNPSHCDIEHETPRPIPERIETAIKPSRPGTPARTERMPNLNYFEKEHEILEIQDRPTPRNIETDVQPSRPGTPARTERMPNLFYFENEHEKKARELQARVISGKTGSEVWPYRSATPVRTERMPSLNLEHEYETFGITPKAATKGIKPELLDWKSRLAAEDDAPLEPEFVEKVIAESPAHAMRRPPVPKSLSSSRRRSTGDGEGWEASRTPLVPRVRTPRGSVGDSHSQVSTDSRPVTNWNKMASRRRSDSPVWDDSVVKKDFRETIRKEKTRDGSIEDRKRAPKFNFAGTLRS